MNPYYVVKYGNQQIEGSKAYGMGKEPVWNDFNTNNHVIHLDDIHSGEVEVQFLNDGDLICSLTLSVPELIATRNANKWYEAKRKGKKSGEFKMQAVYDGPRPEESKQNSGKAPAVGVAQGIPVDTSMGGQPPMGMPPMGGVPMGGAPMGGPPMGMPPGGAAPQMQHYPQLGAAQMGPPVNQQAYNAYSQMYAQQQ